MFAVRLIVLVLLTMYSYGVGMETGPLNSFGKLVAGSFFVLAPALYFLPTYEAWSRDHVNLTPIVLVNTFLGWTLIGWGCRHLRGGLLVWGGYVSRERVRIGWRGRRRPVC